MKTTWYHHSAALAAKVMLVTVLLTLGSCKKDEEPSTRGLLIGSWDMVEAEYEGVSVNVNEFRIEAEFQSDGDYRETITLNGGSDTYHGQWELSGNNELELEYDDGERWELKILSINKTELKVEDDEGFEALFEKDN